MNRKMKFLRYLVERREMFVPLDNIPGGNIETAEALLREGMIGVERLEKCINCVLLIRGHELIESAKKKEN
ncbi:MAG: hypothetical protein V1818_01925 [Candidatus Aenigmatarchaeota archaeon]